MRLTPATVLLAYFALGLLIVGAARLYFLVTQRRPQPARTRIRGRELFSLLLVALFWPFFSGLWLWVAVREFTRHNL